MKACRGSHKQEFQKLWRWRCSKAWPHLPNEVLRQAKVCLPVVTRPWPFLKHYMVYVKIRFKLRNLSVPSSSPPFVFSQTYSYSHDVHLSCHIKIIAKCAGEEEEQLLQVIFWKTPYMIVDHKYRGATILRWQMQGTNEGSRSVRLHKQTCIPKDYPKSSCLSF